jgi:hypothetical protein
MEISLNFFFFIANNIVGKEWKNIYNGVIIFNYYSYRNIDFYQTIITTY